MNRKPSSRSFSNIFNRGVLSVCRFLMDIPFYLYHSLSVKDFWSILFISCLALYIPILWAPCGLFLVLKTHSQYRHSHVAKIENVQNMIVISVQLNQLKKLGEAIEANPEILYCDYQRRSLISWCRYYNNPRAQELVVQMMEKYPKVVTTSRAA